MSSLTEIASKKLDDVDEDTVPRKAVSQWCHTKTIHWSQCNKYQDHKCYSHCITALRNNAQELARMISGLKVNGIILNTIIDNIRVIGLRSNDDEPISVGVTIGSIRVSPLQTALGRDVMKSFGYEYLRDRIKPPHTAMMGKTLFGLAMVELAIARTKLDPSRLPQNITISLHLMGSKKLDTTVTI